MSGRIMSDDNSPILRHTVWSTPARWGAVIVLAAVAGLVLGFTIATYPRPDPSVWMDQEMAMSIDGYPPVIAAGWPLAAAETVGAGLVVGIAGALAVRARPLLGALVAGLVAGSSATVAMVLLQWQRGRWPVGAIDGRMIVFAAVLLILICGMSILAGWLGSLALNRRRVIKCAA